MQSSKFEHILKSALQRVVLTILSISTCLLLLTGTPWVTRAQALPTWSDVQEFLGLSDDSQKGSSQEGKEPDPTFTIVEPTTKGDKPFVYQDQEQGAGQGQQAGAGASSSTQGPLVPNLEAAPFLQNRWLGVKPQPTPVPIHPVQTTAPVQEAGKMELDTSQDLVLGMPAADAKQRGVLAPPIISTMCCLVTGDNYELFSRHIDDVTPMASLTKMMTVMCVLDSKLNFNMQVPISYNASHIGEGVMGYPEGATFSVRELFDAALIRSGNDAAYALAEATDGTIEAFATRMNGKAAELGCTHTHYVTPHGLDTPGHHSTVREQIRIAQAMMSYPEARKVAGTKAQELYFWGTYKEMKNTNQLLQDYPGVSGVKTGYTNGAGYSLMTYCNRDGVDFYALVMGLKTHEERVAASKQLLDWGYAFYPKRQLAKKGQVVSYVPCPYRYGWFVPLLIDKSAYERTYYANAWAYECVDAMKAPVRKAGVPAGSLRYYRQGKLVAHGQLVSGVPVSRVKAENDGMRPFIFGDTYYVYKKPA